MPEYAKNRSLLKVFSRSKMMIWALAIAANITAQAVFADTYESTAGQTRSSGSTTTSTSLTTSIPLANGQANAYDPAALQTYYKTMWTQISKNWWVPEELFFKQVKVKMVIEKDGKLSSATLAATSGDNRADTLALIAIKRAAPFPPLPDGLPTPFQTIYTIGFASNKDRDFVMFNGARYGKGEAYTLATGTKVGHSDRQLSELDKQFHIKKEAALTKMNKLYDAIAAEKENTNKKAKLLTDYADCLITIQEQGEGRDKLSEALVILDKNQADEATLYPCLSKLAQLDYSLGDLKTAEPLFIRAIAIKEKETAIAATGATAATAAAASNGVPLKSLLETYAKLLYKQNRATEADEIYKKIKTLP
ncbi:MAG: energy transducer TonB [Cyanobacteria bacterium REEB67]|nr:energy transducer TonB [Cyanobacteria bacterium REEB67]